MSITCMMRCITVYISCDIEYAYPVSVKRPSFQNYQRCYYRYDIYSLYTASGVEITAYIQVMHSLST